jgi:hypothetical protein
MVFAGCGVFCAPVDWIFQYLGRPKVIITKSQYIERARGLAQRAKQIRVRGRRRGLPLLLGCWGAAAGGLQAAPGGAYAALPAATRPRLRAAAPSCGQPCWRLAPLPGSAAPR